MEHTWDPGMKQCVDGRGASVCLAQGAKMSCCYVGLVWEGCWSLWDSSGTCAGITEESFPPETCLVTLP